VSTNATSFGALAALGRDGFFERTVTRRTCVVVSDAETRSYSAAAVARTLEGGRGCRLVVVRVGGSGDRVYVGGRAEPAYAPDAAAAANASQLAEAAGGRAYGENDVSAGIRALRTAAAVGPTRRAPAEESSRSLAPFAGLFGLVLVLGLVLLRLGRPTLQLIRTSA
jgi:hypothetical protein